MTELSEAQMLLARLKTGSTNRTSRAGSELYSNLSFRESESSTRNSQADILPSISLEEGEPDSTTIVAGLNIILKSIGTNAGCISVISDQEEKLFKGVVEGFGFGDDHESFILSNRHERNDSSSLPIRYGDKILIRSHFAREKLLAPNTGGDIVFETNMPTKTEDWEIYPSEMGSTNDIRSSTTTNENSTYVQNKLLSRAYVRSGDHITLRSCISKEFLIIKQIATGNGTKNILRTANELQSFSNIWQVSMAGMPCPPSWSLNRPFLTGNFLIDSDKNTSSSSNQSTSPRKSNMDNESRPSYEPSNQILESLFRKNSSSSSSSGSSQNKPKSDLLTLPISLQEKFLLDDLLSVFMGIEGIYIHIQKSSQTLPESQRAPNPRSSLSQPTPTLLSLSSVKFVVDDADYSLTQLVKCMLPAGELVVKVKAYIAQMSRHEFGMVNHALCSALNVLLKEFNVLIAQLEHQMRMERMTLQKLWFFIQPSLHTLTLLGQVCDKCEGHTGGNLLNVLHHIHDQGGDVKTNDLLSYILGKTSIPYMEMLKRWIFEGVLIDPYKEFMISEDSKENVTKAKESVTEDFISDYWDQRYSLCPHQVVCFLSRLADKVLTTGKYLNVVRECGQDVRCPDADALSWNGLGSEGSGISASMLNEGAFSESIERAFKFASSTLLDVLLNQNQLILRLRSMKHYFLMDEADLYVIFMDLAEQELKQPFHSVSQSRVESLLQMAVLSSASNRDIFKDDVSCDFSSHSMNHHLEAVHSSTYDNISSTSASTSKRDSVSSELKGIEVFMIDYKVRWPVSLVVSKRSITKYQLIFRHLFFARYVERCLKTAWQEQQSLKELNVHYISGRSYCLRHRMLCFMQSIVYYMTYEVMEPRWHEMEAKLRTCLTMDDVLKTHAELQDSILKECLLTNQALLKTLTKIMTICLLFSEQMSRFFQANPLISTENESIPPICPLSPNMKKDYSNRYRKADEVVNESTNTKSIIGDSTAKRVARIEKISQKIKSELQQPSYKKMIISYEKNFDKHFQDFMSDLMTHSRKQSNSHLANLVMRLNFNNFFSDDKRNNQHEDAN